MALAVCLSGLSRFFLADRSSVAGARHFMECRHFINRSCSIDLQTMLLDDGENAISHGLYDGFFFSRRFWTLEA